LPDKYVSALEQGKKFSFTEYDFQGLADVSVKLASQIVVQAGGRIEVDEDGEEVFVIPIQEPQPSALERSWDAGPVAGTTFTSEDFPHMKWMWLTPYLVWILLLVAFVLPKENRNAQALWIFVAILAAYVIWELLGKLVPDVVPKIGESKPISLVAGLAIVFLLGERLAKLKWPALMFVSFLIIIATGFIGLLSVNTVYYEGIHSQYLATIVGGALVIVFSTALTGRKCREKFTNKRFLLYLLMWFFIITSFPSIAASIGAFGVAIVVKYYWWFLMTACIQAILVYLLTLPLWILALKNTLYNQRLRSCLGLSDQTAEG
jgi:hypothetical protein